MITSPFLERSPPEVARALLGCRLFRRLDGELLGGRIVETEAYGSGADTTSHAARGATARTKPMFGPVGKAYVYLIYGMYHCLNVVAHEPGAVGAVLIRALAPEQGLARMQSLRNQAKPPLLTSGPGRLAQALAITTQLNGIDLLQADGELLLVQGPAVAAEAIGTSARIGVTGSEADRLRPWRFFVLGEPNVSRPR